MPQRCDTLQMGVTHARMGMLFTGKGVTQARVMVTQLLSGDTCWEGWASRRERQTLRRE